MPYSLVDISIARMKTYYFKRLYIRTSYVVTDYKTVYKSINSTKCAASGAGNITEPRLTSQVGKVREVVCA